MILIGLCGLTLTTLAIGFIHNFILLLVVRVLQGMAAASFSPVSLTYVTEVFPIKNVLLQSVLSVQVSCYPVLSDRT